MDKEFFIQASAHFYISKDIWKFLNSTRSIDRPDKQNLTDTFHLLSRNFFTAYNLPPKKSSFLMMTSLIPTLYSCLTLSLEHYHLNIFFAKDEDIFPVEETNLQNWLLLLHIISLNLGSSINYSLCIIMEKVVFFCCERWSG